MLGIKTDLLNEEDKARLTGILKGKSYGLLNEVSFDDGELLKALTAQLFELESWGYTVINFDKWVPEWYLHAGFDITDSYRHATLMPYCLEMERAGENAAALAGYERILDGIRQIYPMLAGSGAGRDTEKRTDIERRAAFYSPLDAHSERMREKFIRKCYSMDKYIYLKMETEYKWKRGEDRGIIDPGIRWELETLVDLIAREYDTLKLNHIFAGDDEGLWRGKLLKRYERIIGRLNG
jgi:hypothetical protein